MTTTETAFELRVLPLTALHESPLNPRKHFDPVKLKELEASIRESGVRVPLVVRPSGLLVDGYEIGAGHRRYQAATAAGVADVPVLIQEMTDDDFAELLTFENLEHEDLHALDEAQGYRMLMERGYDVGRIAGRLGKSVKYVYDRVKLLQLTKELQRLFLAGKMTAGHAILLARLSPADQTRAIDDESGGLFEAEHVLWDPDGKDDDQVKPVSVRELQGWIDQHVRFNAGAADPMLFPETVSAVMAAKEGAEKLVPITHEHYIQPEARDGRTFGPRSWKRADGRLKAKTCNFSVTGVIVIGPGRGEAFKVCVDKDKCATHWGSEKLERARKAARGEIGGSQKGAAARYEREQAKAKALQGKTEAARARWKTATPAILQALALAVKKASPRSRGLLADIVLRAIERPFGVRVPAGIVPRGTTAEDLVRHAAFSILAGECQGFDAHERFPKQARAFGLDVRKLVDAAAPLRAAADKA